MNFYENYLRLCNSVDKTPSRVVLDIGLQKSAVTRWKSGGEPTDATLLKLAEYFNVPVSELTGEAQQKKPDPTIEDGLTETQIEAVEFVKTLDDNDLRRLLRMFKAYRQEE